MTNRRSALLRSGTDWWKRSGNYRTRSLASIRSSDSLETYRLPEKDDVGLDEPLAFRASRGDFSLEASPHYVAIKRRPALYAPLASEAPVRFDDFMCGHAGSPLESVYVLGEACVEETFVGEEADK